MANVKMTRGSNIISKTNNKEDGQVLFDIGSKQIAIDKQDGTTVKRTIVGSVTTPAATINKENTSTTKVPSEKAVVDYVSNEIDVLNNALQDQLPLIKATRMGNGVPTANQTAYVASLDDIYGTGRANTYRLQVLGYSGGTAPENLVSTWGTDGRDHVITLIFDKDV